MDISERIKFYRKEQGLTQKDLGIRINKSAQVVSNWERGYTTSINQDDILKLSNAFGIAIEKLVDKDASLFDLLTDSPPSHRKTNVKSHVIWKTCSTPSTERRQ